MYTVWHWFTTLHWWAYLLIVYVCGIPVTALMVIDAIRTEELDVTYARDEWPGSFRSFRTLIAVVALIPALWWPYTACRVNWWKRLAGIKIERRDR